MSNFICFGGREEATDRKLKAMKEHMELPTKTNAYPKMILARTHQENYQYEGIQIVDIANWLINV